MSAAQASVDEIIRATTSGGQRRFHICGAEVFHGCLFCEAEFPQTEDGWKEKRRHEYERHGQGEVFEWHELHGKRLEIAIVGIHDPSILYENDDMAFDIYGRDDAGQVYLLARDCRRYSGRAGGWKWRNNSHVSALLNSGTDTPNAAASPLGGSRSTDAK